MKKFIFRPKLPLWKTVLGFAGLCVGIWSLATDFVGFIIIGIGVFLLLVEGSEFDFVNNRYRKTKSILGIAFGKWQTLPKIEYVSVFKTIETTTLRSRSAEANVKKDIIKLNLFYNNNRKILAFKTYDKEEAFLKAKEIATLLNVDILDATEREYKWL